MKPLRAVLALGCMFALWAPAQTDPKQRIKTIRDLYKRSGASAMPEFRGYLKDSDPEVKREAVRAIVASGTAASLEPLIEAAADPDAEVQIRAVEGLTNFYYPGYVRPDGLTGGVKKLGKGIKGKFTDTNDQVIEGYITVRPEVEAAVTRVVKSSATMQAKAAAARAAGVLRARSAVPALVEVTRTKDSTVLYEALNALQKIRDPQAAPGIAFLLQDLNERVQVAAIETTGLLQNHEALPGLREALSRAKSDRVRSAALSAIAMMPEESNRNLFEAFLGDRDDDMRASAAEGFARLKNPADRDRLTQAFDQESKMKPRLAMAFAASMLGRRDLAEMSPLQYLVNTLNSSAYNGVALGYLEELARDRETREALYPNMATRTRDEKTGLATILSRSGDAATVPVLEQLTKDSDTAVAQTAASGLRTLRVRI